MALLNPPAALLGTANAVVAGRSARYEHRFAGPLSVKTVVAGTATWETRYGRFEVGPGSALVLNEGEEYEITVDALQPVETFCFFFERGFVEDAWRASTTGSAELLDDAGDQTVAFSEKLHFDGPLVAAMKRAHAGMQDSSFFDVARELVHARSDIVSRVA